MTGRVVHFEVPYDDADRARAFYSEVFGWTIQPVPEFDYNFVQTGPTADTGGLFQNGAAVIYQYPDTETLLEAEAHGGNRPPLPGSGTKPPTERP